MCIRDRCVTNFPTLGRTAPTNKAKRSDGGHADINLSITCLAVRLNTSKKKGGNFSTARPTLTMRRDNQTKLGTSTPNAAWNVPYNNTSLTTE